MGNVSPMWASAAFVALIVFGGLVLWLTILVIRLRMEALINRRVIASLQKSRFVEPKATHWGQTGEILRLFVLGMVSIGGLLLVYLAVAN